MLIANFWHIKKSNGLFFYGLDYIHEMKVSPKCILVKPALYQIACNMFPKEIIVACGFLKFFWEILKGLCKGALIYTPSSHPYPFINKQFVVLHDTYPFLGLKGSLKKWMFVLSAKSSNCKLAYINKSESYKFYQTYGFSNDRLVFAPNRYPYSNTQYKSNLNITKTTRVVIGLVGTDSPKKNYHRLFTSVQDAGLSNEFHFLLYGHPTDYYSELVHDFKKLSIELTMSDRHPVNYFLGCIDALVSIAEHEGFGRPIASALISGVPCFLIDNPVFKEFYSDGAFFYNDEVMLIQDLVKKRKNGMLQEVYYLPPIEVIDAFKATVQKLQYKYI